MTNPRLPSGQLYEDSDLFTGDPLKPDLEQVCPASVVASLTGPQREQRVIALIAQAHQIVDTAWALADGRMRAAWCLMFSGGNDSTVLAHMMRHRVDYAVHANTTIGIEETRRFVRDTCAQWGLPLLEPVAPEAYRDLVLEKNRDFPNGRGFPGPGFHFFYYTRLKERCFDAVRSELVGNSRRERMLNIAGRRRAESDRRKDIPAWEVDGSAIWASPLVMWTKLDLNTYRLMHMDSDPVPVNETSELLHMSGECLCGAMAHPGELDEIRDWYPATAAVIEALEAEADVQGIPPPFNRWGHGQGRPGKEGRLCGSCTSRYQMSLFGEGAA